MFSPDFRERCGSEQIPLGPLAKNEPLTIPVERFVSMLRFEHKGKLDGLGLELSLWALKNVKNGSIPLVASISDKTSQNSNDI